MAWIRLDDQVARHPKFVTVGPVASWLWVCGQSYCAQYLTDGFIPFGALEGLGAFSSTDHHLYNLSTKLEDVGLWERVVGGWQVHDYLEYQPSREEVEKRRETRRENGRHGGRPPSQKPRTNLDTNQDGTGTKANGEVKTEAKLTPVPVPLVRTKKEKDPAAGAAVPLPARSAGDLGSLANSYHQSAVDLTFHRLTPDTAPALPRRRNGN